MVLPHVNGNHDRPVDQVLRDQVRELEILVAANGAAQDARERDLDERRWNPRSREDQRPPPLCSRDAKAARQPGNQRRERRPDIPFARRHHQRVAPTRGLIRQRVGERAAHREDDDQRRPSGKDDQPRQPAAGHRRFLSHSRHWTGAAFAAGGISRRRSRQRTAARPSNSSMNTSSPTPFLPPRRIWVAAAPAITTASTSALTLATFGISRPMPPTTSIAPITR